MLYVNKELYTKYDVEQAERHITEIVPADQIHHRITALALKEPMEIISFVHFIIACEGSVLLLNGDTPKAQALKLAQEAGCRSLFHDTVSQGVQFLDGSVTVDTPSLLQYSSGTTGKPKLIRRPWQQVEREIANYNEALCSDPDEMPIVLVPVSHSFGLITGVLAALKREAVPIIVTDKNPKFAAHVIQSTRSSIVYGVPYLIHMMHSIMKNESRFHKVVSSGAPLTGMLLANLKSHAEQVYQQYGCSELGCISLGPNPASPADVGKPLKHLNVTTAGDEAAPNEIVVEMDGNTVFTRDAGWKDANGRIHIAGRMDDTINVTGLKVLPYEIEQVLYGLSGIQEAVVYKTAHKVWGEAVKAMIVVDSDISPVTVKQWCIEHLPQHKVPSQIEVVSKIPKTPAGKISRRLLSENY